MRVPAPLLVAMAVCMLAACSSTPTPPKSSRVSIDPSLAQHGGTVLLVDACVIRDVLGDDDYFLIDESKRGAHKALESLNNYIKNSGIIVRAKYVPFVCGATTNSTNKPILASENVDGTVREALQPLGVSTKLESDSQYLNALSEISAYALQSVMGKGGISREDAVSPDISTADFQNAAAILKSRTQASSLLYLGIKGVSRSAGKAATQAAGSFLYGLGTGIATTVPLSSGSYAQVFVYPEHHDGIIMRGALIDLETNQITRTPVVQQRGDPVEHPELMANTKALDLLFHDMVFKKAQDPSNGTTHSGHVTTER